MHVEGLVPEYLYLVTLLSSEQDEEFERFCLQLIQIINRTSSFKIKWIGNNAKASRVNHNSLWGLTFPRSRFPLQVTA